MEKMEMEPDKQENSRNERGRWTKGHSGNYAGRPKGITMKEYARQFLSRLTDEERDDFMDGLDKEVIWKMAEGNPHTTSDETIVVTLPKPILGGITYGISSNDSGQQDS